jgi:hypothetical protein
MWWPPTSPPAFSFVAEYCKLRAGLSAGTGGTSLASVEWVTAGSDPDRDAVPEGGPTGKTNQGIRMASIEKSIEVHVPVHMAYKWTQFEEFPRFMEGVEDVRQTDYRDAALTLPPG